MKRKKIFNFIILLVVFSLITLLIKYHFTYGVGKQPNILLISLDACRADHLSCYGYSRLTSPFLDTIANKGTRFENAFVNTHSTPPSHTTIFSSLYTETHQVGFIDPGSKSFFLSIPENIVMLQEILQDNGYITLGVSEGKIFHEFGFSRGFTEFISTKEVSVIDSVANAAIRLIKKYNKEKNPIFLFLHTFEIHSPYMPPQDYMKFFGDYSSNVPLHKPWGLWKYANDVSKLAPEDLDFLKAMYDREIRFSDDVLRKMFGELHQLDFFKNYLLIITSDHGEEFGDHGGLGHRGLLYDELIHVPLIIAGTDIPAENVDKQLVGSIDIMPTILGVAGIHAEIPMEGRNLFSAYQKLGNQEQAIFSQYGSNVYCFRTTSWKLIETKDPQKIELYDLLKDPTERNNIANSNPILTNKFINSIETWRNNRLNLNDIKKIEIEYSKESLDKLRTLGYIE